MKNSFVVVIILLLSSAGAKADALLTCKDSLGHEIFQGYIGTDKAVENERINHEQEVYFTFAVSEKPVIGLDRATFTRKTGIDLKNCMGPYAKIYEKQEAGNIHCAAGKIENLAEIGVDDAQILESLGLAKSEADCSVIFPKEKIPGPTHSN
jgi:hypothetical protein